METQKLIIVLLITAILFSTVSIILNVSLSSGLKPLDKIQPATSNVIEGNLGGNVNLVIEKGKANE